MNIVFNALIIFSIALFLSCSKEHKNKNQNNKNNKSEVQSANRKFMVVNIKNLRIRSTPDLEGPVLERLADKAVIEYMNDSTTFTTPLKINGKNYDLPWYKVKSESGNIGWLYGACVEFLTDDENRRILTLREDALMADDSLIAKKNKSIKTNRDNQKFDSELFAQFRAGLFKISYSSPDALSRAINLFETLFKTESLTADKAFGEFLLFHNKVLDYYQSEVSVSKYKFMANEIRNYGTPNMEYDATTIQMVNNGITFGLKADGNLFLKQNTDYLLRKFLRIVSDPMQQFLEQYALEDEKQILEDEKIKISIVELASYVVFWDKFLSRFPNFSLKELVVENRKKYAVLLLNGSAKTAVFKEEKLTKPFKEAYEILISRMGSSPFILSMKDYYKALEKEKFKESSDLIKLKNQIIDKQ
jgi:hypothetical protein